MYCLLFVFELLFVRERLLTVASFVMQDAMDVLTIGNELYAVMKKVGHGGSAMVCFTPVSQRLDGTL